MADLKRLPNLAALRAFEAAARHENFSRAADEIHLTHGAISHQVRALEEELGQPLFIRHGKRISVTFEGERFAEIVRRALGEIAAAADGLRVGARQKRLTVTSLPSFAARWLAPRLGRYIEENPEIEVVLQSSNHLTDFVRESVDIGIRFGGGVYPGLTVELLLEDYYYPVTSPDFKKGKLPQTLRELARSTLLRCDGEPWAPWFAAVGLRQPEPTGGVVFQDSSMLIRAATEGQGIALARHSLVGPDVAAGSLVRLFDVAVKSVPCYYLVYPPGALQKPDVAGFRDWLMKEMRELQPVGVV